jgi:hypothetical protein
MMHAMLLRDARLFARRRGMLAAAALHGCLLSAFVLAWAGAAVPMLPGDDLYEQQRSIQWMFMALATPWIVARGIGAGQRNAWAWLSLVTGLAPSRLVAGRLVTIGLFLIVAMAAAWPAVLLAQQMSAVNLPRVAADQARLFLFVITAAVVSMHVIVWLRDPVAGWLVATGVVLALFSLETSLVSGGIAASISLSAILVAAVFLLWRRADRTLCYLDEERA